MELEKKQKLIQNNKDTAVAALDSYLDKLYNLTDGYKTEDGDFDSSRPLDKSIADFVKELIQDTIKFEDVRLKLLANDFNLSLYEVNLIALAYYYVTISMEHQIENAQKALAEIKPLIPQLMEENLNLKN